MPTTMAMVLHSLRSTYLASIPRYLQSESLVTDNSYVLLTEQISIMSRTNPRAATRLAIGHVRVLECLTG